MIRKIEGALQELEETVYGMELFVESGTVKKNTINDLTKEADEIIAILVPSAKTLKYQDKS